jgi:hypothetical protein
VLPAYFSSGCFQLLLRERTVLGFPLGHRRQTFCNVQRLPGSLGHPSRETQLSLASGSNDAGVHVGIDRDRQLSGRVSTRHAETVLLQ